MWLGIPTRRIAVGCSRTPNVPIAYSVNGDREPSTETFGPAGSPRCAHWISRSYRPTLATDV